MTYADVSHARQQLAYEPQVSLASGVRRFLQWYSAYYKVQLPASMAPTRRERDELKGKYDIPPGDKGGSGGGGGGGRHRSKHARRMHEQSATRTR